MIFKWALILFGVFALALVVLSKAIVFLRGPAPARTPAGLGWRAVRGLGWRALVLAAIGLAVLAVTLTGSP